MLSIFDQGALPPCPQNFNLAEYVLGHADANPDKIALAVLNLSGSERYSYAKLKSAILGTGQGLLNLGLTSGDRVLMRLGNTLDFPIAYLGAIAVGLVPVPTSAQLTETEVRKQADMISPDLVLVGDGVACPSDISCPVLGEQELREFRQLPPADFDRGDPNRLAYILFTSGTSGKPRPVAHAHRVIWARQMMWDGWYGLTHQDRLLHAGAFNWSFTLGTGLLDPWSVGATALIPGEGITTASLPLLLKRHDATIFAGAPGVYRQMMQASPSLNLPKLRHGLCAGEKLSDTIHQAWRATTGLDLHEAFGMSECSTFISASPSFPTHGSLGRPQVGRRIAIVDKTGPVEMGSVGQIAISRDDPGLMLGYLGALEETVVRFQGEWFLTGDLGSMNEDFTINYEARSDDMMNAGGFRVSPLEVESVLAKHPKISEVAVTDIEVKQDTRVIAAFYLAERDIAEEELSAYVSQRLARYKQPRLFRRIDALPRGANNKLLRKKLKLELEKP